MLCPQKCSATLHWRMSSSSVQMAYRCTDVQRYWYLMLVPFALVASTNLLRAIAWIFCSFGRYLSATISKDSMAHWAAGLSGQYDMRCEVFFPRGHGWKLDPAQALKHDIGFARSVEVLGLKREPQWAASSGARIDVAAVSGATSHKPDVLLAGGYRGNELVLSSFAARVRESEPERRALPNRDRFDPYPSDSSSGQRANDR